MSKRVNFIGIQNSHTIGIKGSVVQPVRTGYDSVIAHRVDKKFAATAQQDGRVIEVSDKHLVLEYNDKTKDHIELGTLYGVSAGKVINNTLITDYSLGQKVKQGDIVAYNPVHFTRDYFNRGQVLYKNSVLARVAFMESNDTEEDSSAISTRLAGEMETTVTKVRTLVIPFEDTVKNMVIEGDTVDTDTPLCTLVSAVFSENNMFGNDALYTLEQLAQSSPKAKYAGVINKIEVIYYGDPKEAQISDSVKRLINFYDNKLADMAVKMKDGRPTTGRIKDSIHVDGNPLPLNHIAVKIYIEYTDGMSVGDKLVVSSQLKSVCTRVMSGRNETKTGKPIDAIFGYQSISNRIVQSAELIGTTNVLLKLISQEVINIYRNARKK